MNAKKWAKRQAKEERERLLATDEDNLIWEPRPIQGEWETVKWTRWMTRCGRYRIHHSQQKYRGEGALPDRWNCETRDSEDGNWRWVETGKLGVGYPRDYSTMEACLEAVENCHELRYGTTGETNSPEILKKAREIGLICVNPMRTIPLPKKITQSQETQMSTTTQESPKTEKNSKKEGTAMKIDMATVVALFQDMGFAVANKWPAKPGKITERIKQLNSEEGQEAVKDVTDKKLKVLAKKIVSVLEKGGTVEVEGDEVKQKKSASKEPSSNGSAAPKAKKEKGKGAEVDRFGSRVGTGAAMINSVITKKPQTLKEITAAAKTTRPIMGHLAKLLKNGHIKKNDQGYYEA